MGSFSSPIQPKQPRLFFIAHLTVQHWTTINPGPPASALMLLDPWNVSAANNAAKGATAPRATRASQERRLKKRCWENNPLCHTFKSCNSSLKTRDPRFLSFMNRFRDIHIYIKLDEGYTDILSHHQLLQYNSFTSYSHCNLYLLLTLQKTGWCVKNHRPSSSILTWNVCTPLQKWTTGYPKSWAAGRKGSGFKDGQFWGTLQKINNISHHWKRKINQIIFKSTFLEGDILVSWRVSSRSISGVAKSDLHPSPTPSLWICASFSCVNTPPLLWHHWERLVVAIWWLSHPF